MTHGNKSEGPASGQAGGQRNNADPAMEEPAFLEPHIQEQLGRVFRSFCDDLIHQPIPDKLVVLLAQLEAKQREKQ